VKTAGLMISAVAGLSLVSAAAWAEDEGGAAPAPASPALTAAAEGAYLPQTLAARVGEVRAFAFASGGYDSSRRGPLLDSAVEATIWGPVAVRAQTTYSGGTDRMRPSVGARVQLLRQNAHGVDGALTVFYKTEGFTETEGEVETFASIGRRFGTFHAIGNLVYGQDPDGNERDGELRAAVFRQMGALVLGIDCRARAAIGTQRGRAATSEPKFDVAGGPVATLAMGPLALFVEAGPSVFKLASLETRVGVATVAGLGGAF
jgi:hypothetical protein